MSFNIRERFKERKFSYKIKKEIDKEKKQEENDLTKNNPLKKVLYSPFFFFGYIKKIFNYFKDEKNIKDNEDNTGLQNITSIEENVIVSNKKIKINNINKNKLNNINTYKIANKNNIKKNPEISSITENKKNIIKNNNFILDKRKKGYFNENDAGKIADNMTVKPETIFLECKIFDKFKKIIGKLDDEFLTITSEAYLINKYDKDKELLNEAVIINNKIQVLMDRLNKIKKEITIITDEKFIEDPSILDDSLLIDDIINYRELINSCEENIIPEKIKLLEEYNHIYINLEELENNITNIKNIKDKRVNELSQRDKKFNNIKSKINNLNYISTSCTSIINEHNKYLDDITKKINKIDEKKFVNYKLKGLNGLLSSSLKYIGLLGLSPLRGVIPTIAVKTVATRELISGMIKNIHYEKKEKVVYSVHNYLSEIDNKIFDIKNINNNIDNAYNDVQKLKEEFKDYYFKYHLKEYESAYKKIEKLEEDIIKNKRKMSILRDNLLKNKDVNKKVLTKVRRLNN